ncbi:MAG: AI-2E family transporter [Chitinophagaceae bacterium]|jgi:predicted PurR-regulated permease PerM|nr:AI-2E family transporter [Chitinophagaceae bacterium]MBK7677916.1 AI-2E family transporter [Chitinophagaceae bacterium]MBK8301233.1 AI-2E family transporter [Chitinophagaceae bacterium]MBK9464434.1 AI-2E family transporter [Chitinophagaceae bacterium]MBK9658438.1 AI-2E family transporter [Chitinophagaceae bacterium]
MNSNVINQNQLRQVFFIILILLMGIVLFMELASFLPALLGGITLYILLHRWMFFLTEKKKWRKGWTAILLMFFSFIVILMPVGLLVNMLSSKVSYAVQHSDELVTALKTVVNNIETRFNVTIASDENINKIGGTITQSLPKILGATFNTLTTIFFMYFILYFMLVNGRYMENTLYEHVPLEDKNVNRLGKEIHMMVVSNAIGIPLIAFAQGLIGLIGYLIIGVKEPFFWFGVTCIAAMLPVIGAALAYIPLAIIFFANNQTGQGIAMLVFGFGIIGTIDNVLRFTLLKKIGNVHPLTTVFGVIIGLSLFGFIGLIFGPLLISLFMLLLKIYSSEFITKQRDINKIMEN